MNRIRPETPSIHETDVTIPFDAVMEPETEAARPKQSCRATSLSAWVAFLTCSMIVFQVLVNVLDSLIVNEKFWQQTKALIAAYAARSDHMCESTNMTLESLIIGE